MPKNRKPKNKVFAMSEDEVLAALTSEPARVTEAALPVIGPASPMVPPLAPLHPRPQDETIVRRPRAS